MGKRIKRKQLAKVIQREFGIPEKESLRIVTRIFEEIRDSVLNNQDTVVITNFGVFFPETLPPQLWKSPKTGEDFLLPERVKIRFKQSRKLTSSQISFRLKPL